MAKALSTKIDKKSVPGHNHLFLIDWNDDGALKEVAVVCEREDGTIHGILIDQLHPLDKARLKKVLDSVHADKYPLWELMSQSRLSNGQNCLDFFHSAYVKTKRPRGARVGGSIADVRTDGVSDAMIGSTFSDPRGASIANETPTML